MPEQLEGVSRAQIAEEPDRPRGVLARLRSGVSESRFALVVILPVAGALAGFAWYWLDPAQSKAPGSRFNVGSAVTANPLEATSDAYRRALDLGEAGRREEALLEGESYVPAFQSQEPGPVPVVAEPILPSAVAPSDVMREQAEVPTRAEAPEPAIDPLLDRDYPEPVARGTALVRDDHISAGGTPVVQMVDDLLAAWNAAPKLAVIRYEAQSRGDRVAEEPATGPGIVEDAGSTFGRALVRAGQMLYAATAVGVDSELGIPVLVEVLEDPLRGALLHGSFEQVRDRMILRFARLSDPGRSLEVRVNAYAVGLECECGAVEGDVSRHWLARVVMPAAFGFAEEYLRAAGEPDITFVVNGQALTQRSDQDVRGRIARGLAGAVARTGEVVQESLPKQTTVRLPRGRELAVVFVDSVREGEEVGG